MIRQFGKQMASVEGYRLNPCTVWQRILMENLFKSLSIQKGFLEKARDLIVDEEKSLEEAHSERNAIIQRLLDLLRNPERYKRQIIDQPKSVDAAREALSSEALAFRFIPTKGDDVGTKFLAFSKDSLIRFLNQASAPEEIYDAFPNACAKGGILGNRKRSIMLGGKTFAAITFRINF